MSYEKQTWKTGDVITDTKLNHMEDGIANTVLVVNMDVDMDNNTSTLDKTWQEIYDAPFAVINVSIDDQPKQIIFIKSLGTNDGIYFIATNFYDMVLTANSPDGYPSYDENGDNDSVIDNPPFN